jgi:hypothetical protein
MAYPIGRSEFNLGAVMKRPKRQVQAELYISSEKAKAYFYLLQEQKDAIEAELGYPIVWEELPARRDSRISIVFENVDPEDQLDWPRQHEWLAKHLNDFHRVFVNRVRLLNADDWNPVEQDESLRLPDPAA